ncbi:MAG TPA: holo-ACP synthase [Egibacteraceae bacterium]|nr:holo-ACP synthase [Actinomycetota bacterium]HWB72934.1 holo-ACP synthase [Egibacteraceae bacterium]
MAVIGVGVDAVEIGRLRAALERSPRLLGRLFTERERALCTSRCGQLRFGGLAARFAAKEAVAKALGTGVRGFGFRDVEVLPDAGGRPRVTLHDGAGRVAAERGVDRVHVSLSHTHDLAVAHAVAEGPRI